MKRSGWLALFATLVACTPEPPSSARPTRSPQAENAALPPPPAAKAATPHYLPEVDRELSYMAGLRELPATARVSGVELNRDELRERLRIRFAEDLEVPMVQGTTELLYAWNLARADFDLVADTLELMTSQLAGYYDQREKRMYLLEDQREDMKRETLWHELVHALQDQHYDLDKLMKWSAGDTDRISALQCLAEGDATSSMIDATLAPQGRRATDLPDDLLRNASLLVEGSPALAQIPAVLKRTAVAAYSDGLAFTNQLRRKGGWASVDSAWRSLPLSTEQILHPEKYLAGEKAEAVPLPPPPPGGLGELLYHDVLGEQNLRLVLEEWMPSRTAAESASDWAGDRVAVYRDGARRGVALRVRYDATPAAERGAKAFVRGGLFPEIEDQPAGAPPIVPLESAAQALRRGKYCGERKHRGPMAVAQRDRDIAIVLGVFSRNSTGTTSDYTCAQALIWAESVLAAH